MIKRVCDQHQLIKHFLNFILKKSLSKTDLSSRSKVNCIFINPVNLQNLGTLVPVGVEPRVEPLQKNPPENPSVLAVHGVLDRVFFWTKLALKLPW